MSDTESARPETWTVGSVLRWAAEDFRSRAFDSPRLDAELLLGKVLGKDRVGLIVESGRALSPEELAAFRQLIQRRRKAEPVAYILGYREFFGLAFQVDSRVLVPRPETELLVEVALERTADAHLSGSALDLCTGSGCVAIAFARRRPTWSVTGVDVSRGAVEVARANAERLGAAWNARFLESDLDRELPPDARFDLVTANAPYIATGELEGLPADVRDHEPRLALDGGPDGLDVVRRLVDLVGRRLATGGVLALEVGAGQAPEVARLLAQRGFDAVDARRDTARIERVVSARSR